MADSQRLPVEGEHVVVVVAVGESCMLHEQIKFAEQNPGITDIIQNDFGQRSIDKAKLGVGLPQISKAIKVCSQAAETSVFLQRYKRCNGASLA